MIIYDWEYKTIHRDVTISLQRSVVEAEDDGADAEPTSYEQPAETTFGSLVATE